jgi:ferric-dicitrate binding protein FerR (iron transport regulator)
MSREHDRPDPELQDRIRDLAPPIPDPAYRERNRKRFTGRIPYEEAADRRLEPARSRGWLWGGAGLAAAATAAAAWFTAGPAAPVWEVWDVPEDGTVLINGEAVSAGKAAGMSLPPRARVRGGDRGRIRLGIPRMVSMELAPGTEVTLGSTRRLLRRPRLHAQVREGTAWGVTGPDFPGRDLRLDTDQARIHVRGTTFAVVSGGDTTCVCVLNGTVEVKCKITGVHLRVHPVEQLLLDASGPERRLSPLSPAQRDMLADVAAHTVF